MKEWGKRILQILTVPLVAGSLHASAGPEIFPSWAADCKPADPKIATRQLRDGRIRLTGGKDFGYVAYRSAGKMVSLFPGQILPSDASWFHICRKKQ